MKTETPPVATTEQLIHSENRASEWQNKPKSQKKIAIVRYDIATFSVPIFIFNWQIMPQFSEQKSGFSVHCNYFWVHLREKYA